MLGVTISHSGLRVLPFTSTIPDSGFQNLKTIDSGSSIRRFLIIYAIEYNILHCSSLDVCSSMTA